MAGIAGAAVLVLRLWGAPAEPSPQPAGAPLALEPAALNVPLPEPLDIPPVQLPAGADCATGPAEAAAANASSLTTLIWSPYNRAETGWAIYVPVIAREINTVCAPETPGFAAALATWQAANRLPANGQLDPATYQVMNTRWLLARPFVVESNKGCPAAATADRLVALEAADIYGKPERLDRDALVAYRQMVADARAQVPAIAANKQLLTVFSGFRDPAADAARCAQDANCEGVTRTVCSAHRTGRAVDLMVGAAPGGRPDSSADANRLAQSRNPAYLWLVAHANRYGFYNYTFEPWHWEWAGTP